MVNNKTLEELEQELNEIDDNQASYGFPEKPIKDSTLKFFREWVNSNDTTKISNISKTEIGIDILTVRSLKKIALFCESQGLDDIKNYFIKRAEIQTSTAMSRNGWFGNLTVTQIKKEQKLKTPDQPKKSLFGGIKKEEGSDAAE